MSRRRRGEGRITPEKTAEKLGSWFEGEMPIMKSSGSRCPLEADVEKADRTTGILEKRGKS
jgi:hypothetical protein